MEIKIVVPLSMIGALDKAVREAQSLREVIELIQPYLKIETQA